MTTTICNSGAVKFKAGANVNSIILASDTAITQFINEAEGALSAITRTDWVNKFSGVSANISGALVQVCSSMAAMAMISYDMSGFTSRAEAETMLDVLNNDVNRGLSVLRDIKQQEFFGVK